MQVIRITPRGYCYGVVDAMTMVRRAAQDPAMARPIHVLGLIVHNRHAVAELDKWGVIHLDGQDRLSLLDQVSTGTVIFSAHGVSPAVKERARKRGLNVVDATCPDVTRTHDLIGQLVADGFAIIYIGKKGHPEPEGAMGEAPPGRVQLVETEDDLADLVIPAQSPVAIVTQTTLSRWDTAALIDRLQQKFPQAQVHNEICMATQLRQEAAVTQAEQCDLVIVVGDERSNNSNRLVQVVQEVAHRPAYLVGTVADIDPGWLIGQKTVGVTAGSSTPSQLTRQVIEFLEAYQPDPVPVA
ncbi:MAG: 4-hydroxy-3-methylbut-2-enyl diphosphate reductase [Sulfobacillus sp.]